VITGPGALNKSGAGRLELDAINAFAGGTVVNGGDVRMVNINGFGSGPVTLNGISNSVGFRFGFDAQTLSNPLVVNGTNNSVLLRGNNTLTQVSGSGTLVGGLVDTGTTLTFADSMAGFSGTIRAGTIPNLRFNPSTGSANATFDLGTGSCKLNNRNGGLTIDIGALIGGSSTILEGASSMNSFTTYVIGGKNLSTTFAGKIQEVIPARTAAIVKTGTGTLTLTGASTYTGGTTVNGGTLLVNNSSGTGTGTNAVTVNNSGRLGGTGFIHGPVTVNSGGGVAPGNNAIGTLTLRSNLTLNAGSQWHFELGTTGASDRIAVTGNLVLGGTLNLTNAPGFGAGTYTLITYGGTLSGSLPAIGTKPAGFNYTVNTATAGQVRLIVQLQTPPVFTSAVLLNGALVTSGTGGPTNGSYYVLTSTNLEAPVSNWIRVATNQFNAAGNFSFTNAINAGLLQQFYRLQLP
jgi:fibronectin-binding autotransporter adhesin